MTERATCPCCGAAPQRLLAEIRFDDPAMVAFFSTYYRGRLDSTALAGGTYRLEQCGRCVMVWQRWILDDAGMEQLYGVWIDSEESLRKRRSSQRHLQDARHCARLLRLFPEPHTTRVLDYGMGWGDWCAMAQAFGFGVHGVEFSSERIEHARARGVRASPPDALPDGPFDFIHLEQVLEHLPEPGMVLQTLTAALSPGGYIHVGVPDARRLSWHAPERLLCKGPAQPLEHINIFTPHSLRRVMARHGCTPARQREMLLRATPLRTWIADSLVCLLRALPPSVFPPGTSLLFRKAG